MYIYRVTRKIVFKTIHYFFEIIHLFEHTLYWLYDKQHLHIRPISLLAMFAINHIQLWLYLMSHSCSNALHNTRRMLNFLSDTFKKAILIRIMTETVVLLYFLNVFWSLNIFKYLIKSRENNTGDRKWLVDGRCCQK